MSRRRAVQPSGIKASGRLTAVGSSTCSGSQYLAGWSTCSIERGGADQARSTSAMDAGGVRRVRRSTLRRKVWPAM